MFGSFDFLFLEITAKLILVVCQNSIHLVEIETGLAKKWFQNLGDSSPILHSLGFVRKSRLSQERGMFAMLFTGSIQQVCELG
jgi:hypothetical protein